METMQTMQMTNSDHQCYETFTYPRFVEGDQWVDMMVQDLTETVGHKKTEKRFLHVMLDGPGAMQLMYAMASNYLDSFYYPIQRKISAEEKRIDLPRVDQSTLGWLPMLQETLNKALSYYRVENAQDCGLVGTPTCTPHMYVVNPCKPGEILYVAVIPALHVTGEHDPVGKGGMGDMSGVHHHADAGDGE